MLKRPPTLDRIATVGAIVLIAAVLSCLSIGASSSGRPLPHDDWRRTAGGWERATAWPKPAVQWTSNRQSKLAKNRLSNGRLDTHPAALALVQLAGAIGALAASASSASRVRARRSHWKAILTRSFRASAFGS